MNNSEEDLYEVILFIIDQTSKAAKQYSQREIDQLGLGITVDQFVLMKIIQNWGKLSQKELAERSLRDPASITRTLDLLQKKGYVLREPIPENRRQYAIQLSPNGLTFIEKAMPLINRLRARAIDGFTTTELESLRAMLHRIKSNFEGEA